MVYKKPAPTSFFSSLAASRRLRVLRDCVMKFRKYLQMGGRQSGQPVFGTCGSSGYSAAPSPLLACDGAAAGPTPERWLSCKRKQQQLWHSLAGHVLQHSARSGALHAQVLERLLHPPPVLKAKGVDAWEWWMGWAGGARLNALAHHACKEKQPRTPAACPGHSWRTAALLPMPTFCSVCPGPR